MAAGRASDWRARLGVGVAAAALPVLTMMGMAGLLEPNTPRGFTVMLVPAAVLLVFLLLRQRRRLLTVLAAGVLGGWALGAGIRVAMFVAAEMGGGMERSVSGTAGLILFAAIPGILLSGVLLAVRGLVRLSPRTVALATTVLCGLLLAGPTRAELLARGNGLVNAVTFLVSGALFGLVMGTVQERLEARWAAPGGEPVTT